MKTHVQFTPYRFGFGLFYTHYPPVHESDWPFDAAPEPAEYGIDLHLLCWCISITWEGRNPTTERP